MATEDAESRRSCRAGAVASGIALLLAVIAAQYYTLAMRQFLMRAYERLDAELPNVTMALIANYPAAVGYTAILLCAAWLVAAFFVRRGAVVVVINSVLLLAVVLFLMMHALASVLPLIKVIGAP